MSTKKIISDQVLLKLSGGFVDNSFPVDERDIWKALEQKINDTFKLKHFSETLPSGETIPDSTMIATYTDNTVTSTGNGKSTTPLPINPISLPKNMGIFLIYDPNNPDVMFIPLQRGQLSLLKADTLLNDLNGEVGYEPKNNIITFTKDLTTLGITSVTQELCVFDISLYSATSVLPIPADMEEKLVNELYAQFSPVQPESGVVNNFTNAGQTQPINNRQ